MKAKIISLILLASLLLTALGILVYADGSSSEPLSAEIDSVYGGVNGIVTLTFDDGDYPTALAVKGLCEKYDLYATLMLIPDRIPTEENSSGKATVSQWRELFADGRLEPQNHSMSHDIALGTNSEGKSPAESVIRYEILDSGDLLDEFFPTNDIICFAPRGGAGDKSLTEAGRALAMTRYYMVRGGNVSGATQSVSPTFDFGQPGSWSYIIAPSVDNKSFSTLKTHIDNAAEQGTWFCALAHLIADEADTYASTYESMDNWFAYIAEVRDRGDIWVTTVSSAVKYMRERQNSTVSASYDGDSVTVSVETADVTADGLALSPEIFDQPLSVKIELPAGTPNNYRYTLNGQCYSVKSFKEGMKKYVRIDVLPDSEVTLTPADADEAHVLKSVSATAPTCLGGGTVSHLACVDCGATFDKKGNPLESITTDKIGAHTLESVPRVEATILEEGVIAHDHCTVCDKNFNSDGEEIEDVTIPKIPYVYTDEDDDAPIYIAVIGVIAAVATIVTVVIIRKRRGY